MPDESEPSWSPAVDAHLRAAGWHPGRQVPIDGWVRDLDRFALRPHPAAAAFLGEFGGLHVARRPGSGVDVAPVEVEFDPTLVGPVGEGLYPLGEAGGGHASLGIDEDGVVFLLFGVQRRLVGTGRQAVANLVEGRRG